jgi:hypothetical protein
MWLILLYLGCWNNSGDYRNDVGRMKSGGGITLSGITIRSWYPFPPYQKGGLDFPTRVGIWKPGLSKDQTLALST